MRANRRNNLIAGSFVVASVVLAVAISAILSDVSDRFVPKNSYIIRFPLSEGVSGIVPGSVVRIGGRDVGRVTEVNFDFEQAGDRQIPAAVDVVILLPRSIEMFENAAPTLASPLIGSMSAINIVDLGSPDVDEIQGASAILEPGEVLRGTLAPPSFLTAAGYGPEQSAAVKRIIASVEDMVTRLDGVSKRLEEDFPSITEKVQATLEDAREIVADLREREPEWADQIDAALDNVTLATENANSAIDEVRSGVGEATGLIADARDTFDENRPKIDRIVDSVESATERIDRETVDLINSTLTSFDETATDAQGLVDEVRTLLADRSPDIRRAIANLRLASDQVKLASIEIRRNPWRLLYRPGAKETRTEVLYDAARSYAAAVSDLRSASESLEIAMSRSQPDAEAVQSLLDQLRETFDRFERTERDLLDKLLQE